jgi:septum formation protein
VTRVVETEVYFRSLANSEIDAYVRTKEPLDKAGAYGMQGLGAVFVERIVGDYWNVVGLPLAVLNELLTATGCCLICRQLHAASRRPS